PGTGRAEASSVRKRQQVGVDEVVASGLRSDPPVEDVAAGADDPYAITIGRRRLCPSGHFATRAMSFDELLDVVKDSHDGPPAQNPSKVGAAAEANADRGAPRPALGARWAPRASFPGTVGPPQDRERECCEQVGTYRIVSSA